MTLGEKVALLRKQKGLSQTDLASMLHTTKQTIGKYEKGIVTNLPLYRVQQLAIALDTTPEFLCGWDGDEPPNRSSLISEITNRISTLTPEQMEQVLRFADFLKTQE